MATSTAVRAVPDPASYSEYCLTHLAGRSAERDFAIILDELDFVKARLWRLPTPRENQTEEPA